MANSDETLFEFPCLFAIKAMGETGDEFRRTIVDIIKLHVAELSDDQIRQKLSRNGKFTSYTVTIMAISKQQLDAIYQDLSAHKDVMMAL